jgi:hypothetical protein
MDFKNKKNIAVLTSMSTSVSIITLFLLRYASFSIQIILGVTISVFCLLLGILLIYGNRLWGAIMMFVLMVMALLASFGRYLDFKGANNHYLLLIAPFLCILVCISAYMSTSKTGDLEKIKVTKKKAIRGIVLFGAIEIFCIYAVLFRAR